VLHNMQRFAPVSLFEELRTAWDTGYTGMGNVFSAYLMAYALCLVPMGVLADRVDNRRLMTIGAFLSLAGSVLFAISPNLNMAILARWGLGISGAFLYVPSVRYLVANFASEKRASAMGWLELGAGLGHVLALTILPGTVGSLGLTGTFLIPSAIAAVLLIGITLVLKSARTTGYGLGQAGTIFRSATFWSFIVFNFLGLLATYALSGWMPTYLRRDFRFSAVEAGTLAALTSVGLMVFSPIAGRVSDRLGARKPVLFTGSLLSVVCLTAMVLSHDIRVVVVASLFMGASSAFTIPVGMIFAGEVFANAGAGLAVGLVATSSQIASSVSGPLFGYVLDLTGAFLMVWGMALACLVARIPFLTVVGERKKQRPPMNE